MNELEILKKDLKWQLTFEEMDWDYFLEIAQNARNEAQKQGVNYTQ